METFSALLAICTGNSLVTGEFPAQRPVTWSFDVFFELQLNKRLSKQSWGWLFETPSCPLWRHCNEFEFWRCTSLLPLCDEWVSVAGSFYNQENNSLQWRRMNVRMSEITGEWTVFRQLDQTYIKRSKLSIVGPLWGETTGPPFTMGL